MYVAAHKNLPIIDCDGNGRAVPELGTTLYALYKVPTTPVVLADREGNVAIGYPKDPFDANAAEKIARGFAIASGMVAAFATWVMPGHMVKKCLVLIV